MRRLILCAAVGWLLVCGHALYAQKLRALIIAGPGDGWQFTRRALENSGRFSVLVAQTDPVREAFKAVDVVVLDGREAAVPAGTPLVAIGGAACGVNRTFPVAFADREHPIARGMGESFMATDGICKGVKPPPKAIVLARAEGEPVLWSNGQGRRRELHIALGHNAIARYEPGFLTVVARGAEWAATGEVTVPSAVPFERTEAKPVRTMVVTGGHAYDTAFDSMFEGQPDIAPLLTPRNVAFTRDIRPRWDVVVLYDLTLEPSEKEKEVLQSFVESGKGLVVLHHAIADHANWPWWYEQVVGGKYFVNPEGDRGISLYKQGQDIVVRPVGDHPIVKGMAPLHVWEETYKNMWISPGVKPLLETDAPSSDRLVGWISPYEKSRVVYIQLGHDRKSFLHPAYTSLVRNAILWSAGRLP